MQSILLFLVISLLVDKFGTIDCHSSNVPSAVLELNEKFLDVKREGNWFVEFYAPWCGHCKKLHPTWETVGNALSGSPIRVGRVDCTRFTDVASKLDIHGFPTIKFFKNGVEIPYEGDRTKEAMVDFALKSLGPEVREIENEASFQRIYNKHYRNGFYVLVVDKDDATKLKDDYMEEAKKLFSKSYFFMTTPESLTKNISVSPPAVVVFKDETYYVHDEQSMPLRKWLLAERWTRMPLVGYGNLYDMGLCCDKLLVLAVLDLVKKKQDPATRKFGDMVHQTIKKHYDRLHPNFQFGWLDGNELANSIVTGNMPIPSLLVFNVSSYQFYLPEDEPEQMTEESLPLFLENILLGTVQPAGGRGVFQRIRRAAFEFYSAIYGMFASQPLLACCLFGLPLGILSVICYTLCSSDATVDREEMYPDEDEFDDDDPDDLPPPGVPPPPPPPAPAVATATAESSTNHEKED